MRIPDKFAQTYKELVRSLRREARDNLKMASLKKPIAITLGEKYRLMAEIESNIADCIVAMWRREHKNAKPLRNCDVGTPKRRPRLAHWAGVEYHYAVCSKCGGQVHTGFETTAEAVAGWPKLYPFCPHCGTPMRSSEYDGPGAKQYRSRKRGGAK